MSHQFWKNVLIWLSIWLTVDVNGCVVDCIRLISLFQSYKPNMVWIFCIIEFKLCWRTDLILWTASFNYTPTSITNISCSSSICAYSIIFQLMGKLFMMSMVFETSNKIVLIKIWNPMLSCTFNCTIIILKDKINKILILNWS